MRALVVGLIILLAGCQSPPAEVSFDGDAAYAFVEGLVMEDGSPRYRVPGTAGHASAADWLESTMAMPGWNVTRQTFTGEDYQALDHGAVSSYESSCGSERNQVPGLVFHNLIATHGEPQVWLGAHWESKEDVPGGQMLGANDGASGVGVLLELMTMIPDLDLDFGIGIVFFDGEDGFEDCHPLAGSLYFVAQNPPVQRFILLDMVGDIEAQFVREGYSLQADPALVDLIWKHGQALWPSAFTDLQRPVFDDHVPFIEAGIPAVDIIDHGRSGHGFPPYWHTPKDDMRNISAQALGLTGQVLVETLTDPSFSAAPA